MDFITSFFSWGEKPKEEIKISNGRDKVSKRFRKPKPKIETKEIEEVDVEDVDAWWFIQTGLQVAPNYTNRRPTR